jgi:glycosyltransferase involved in cell wall biosynthesis
LEGLQFVDGIHALIANTPIDFAHRIRVCLDSVSTRKSLGFRARQFVEKNYSWDLCVKQLEITLLEVTKAEKSSHAHRD